MENQEFLDIKNQIHENYILLKENNLLLHEIIKQNQLMAEIVVESIWYYSYYHYWPEPGEIEKKRKELAEIYHQNSKKREDK